MPYRLHPPRFIGLSQFNLYILSLEKQGCGLLAPKALCISKQPGQGRARPGRDDIEDFRLRVLDSSVADFNSETELLRHGFQEPAFLRGRFTKHNAKAGPFAQEFRKHEAWKPGASSEIDQGSGRFGDQSGELCRIPKMTSPEIGQGRARNKVLPGIPILKNFGIELNRINVSRETCDRAANSSGPKISVS